MGKKGMETNDLRRSGIFGGVGVLLALALTFLYALLCSASVLPQGREGLFARGILAIASAVAAWLSYRKRGTGKLLSAAVTGGVILAFVLLLALLTKNSSVINISLLYDLAAITFGVLTGCLLTARHKKRRRKHL